MSHSSRIRLWLYANSPTVGRRPRHPRNSGRHSCGRQRLRLLSELRRRLPLLRRLTLIARLQPPHDLRRATSLVRPDDPSCRRRPGRVRSSVRSALATRILVRQQAIDWARRCGRRSPAGVTEDLRAGDRVRPRSRRAGVGARWECHTVALAVTSIDVASVTIVGVAVGCGLADASWTTPSSVRQETGHLRVECMCVIMARANCSSSHTAKSRKSIGRSPRALRGGSGRLKYTQ
jgi:hypothetical protein